MERRCRKRQQCSASLLTDDLVAEILARVPYRSLCRFRCVSRSWLALCTDPGIRSRSPRILSGFFYPSMTVGPIRYLPRFANASGRGRPMVDPSLSFLPRYEGIDFIDCCNGLLLCRYWKMSEPHYVVCNPATYKMIVLPGAEGFMDAPLPTIRLGFDPAVSSHFRVFFLVRVTFPITGVEIYSSETGGWTFRQSEWGGNARVSADPKSAFFNGTLHLTALDSLVVTVDTQGIEDMEKDSCAAQYRFHRAVSGALVFYAHKL